MTDRSIRLFLFSVVTTVAVGSLISDLHALTTSGPRCALLSVVRPLCRVADR